MQCLISDLNKLRFGQPELLPETLIFAKSISFPIPRLYFFHFLKISDAAALSGELRCPLADFFLLNHHLLRACCYFILWKCKWISVHFSRTSRQTPQYFWELQLLCNVQCSKILKKVCVHLRGNQCFLKCFPISILKTYWF